MMKPYYQDASATIYHGDCREVLAEIEADVLITDPPYGIDLGKTIGRGDGHGLKLAAYGSFDDSYDAFVFDVAPRLNAAILRTKRGAVFSGPHIWEQRKPTAIGGVYCPAGQGRHGWGFKTFLPVLFYGNAPNLNLGAKPTVLVSSETPDRAANPHPVPKPLGWMTWLVGLASAKGETVLDPFMGSGTTLRAAKDLGRKSIGIEIEEKYCEVAARRLAQECLFASRGE